MKGKVCIRSGFVCKVGEVSIFSANQLFFAFVMMNLQIDMFAHTFCTEKYLESVKNNLCKQFEMLFCFLCPN